MKYSNSIEYNISTKFDSSGITKLKSELAQLELKFQNMGNKNQLFKFDEYRAQIQGLGDALTEAFNPSLGIINLQQFKTSLKENQVTAQGLRDAFKAAGADGQIAFNNLIGQIGRLDTGIKRTSSAVDKMFTTFSNTFRWGLVSSFWSQFLNAIHSSVEYTRELDDSLTQIMLVTDYSRDSMNEYARAANEAAKAVGQTTVGMTNASLIFAQQGYDLDQSQQLATLSAKLANASQQDTAATSDQITAYMNAYGLQNSMDELVQAMDNWAKIANISAADVEEIALASQRAASMANAVGVSGEALAAQIATIESVTREAPEQIGNGLKTLYARFSDLKLGKDDEDGIGLGKVTSTLQQIGVQVVDAFGNVRDMDDIIEDLMVVWQDLDDTSKTAAAQALAGKHQVNRFMALMENADMYQEYKGATGASASGTLEQMNTEYLDSLQGRMIKLQSTLEGLFNDVFTTDMVYPLIDALTKLAEAVDTLFKSVGGGPTVILGLASAFTKLFSNSIARSITDANLNNALQKQRALNFEDKEATLAYLGSTNPNPDNANSQAILNYAQQINNMSGSFNVEQMNRFNEILQEMVVNANAAAKADGELKTQLEGLNTVSNILFGQGTESFIDEAGAVNATALIESLQGKTEAFKNSLSFIKTAQADLGDLSESTTKLLRKIQQGLESGNVDIEEYKNNIEDLRFVLNLLKTALPQDKVKELSALFDEAEMNTEDWATDSLPKLISQLKGAQFDITKVVEGLKEFAKANKDLTPEQLEQYLQKLEELAAKAKIAQGAATGTNKLGETTIDVAKQQQNNKIIIDTVSAIGQLSFAVQSLGNLPSIWRDKDLSNAEKFYQTVTNITVALPSLITSFDKVGKAVEKTLSIIMDVGENIIKTINIEAIEKEAQAQEKLNIAKIKGAAAEGADAAATGADVIEKEADTVATEGATVAQQGLNAATLAFPVTVIITAIALIVTWLSKWKAEQQALNQERLDASNEQVENAKKELDSIEELYEAWQKTGEGAEELRQALEDQAEALGVIVTAADNYETLKQKIEEATAAQLEYNASLRRENAEAPEYNFSVASQLNDEDRERLGITTTRQRGRRRGSGQRTSYAVENPAETLRIAQEMRDEASNQILANQQEMMLTTDKDRYEDLQIENAELQRQIGLYDTLIQQNQEAYNYNKETVETAVQANALYGNIAFKQAQSYEQMMTYLQTIEGFSELTLEDQIILAQQAAEWAGNLEAAADAQWALAQYQVNQNMNIGSEGEEYHLGQQGLDTINYLSDTYGFSDEQKTSILEMFDWSDPNIDANVAALARRINEGLAQELTLDEILNSQIQNAGNVFDPNVFQYTDEQIAEIMKKAGLEDVSLDDYVQTFKDMGGAGIDSGKINTVREHIDDLTSSLEREREALREIPKNTPEYDEQVKQIKEMQNELDQANEHLEHLAISALETSNGLDELSSRWNDISDAINNSASPGELTATYTELRNILAQILNVDPSAITQSFMESANVLESLGRLAEGDLTAINDLRAAFAEPLNIRTYLDTIGFEGDIATLLGLVDQAQAALPDLEVGAYLEDEQFLNALTEMVMSGQIAAEDIKNIFEGLGYDVQVHYDTEMTFPNVVAHMEARKMTGADDMAMETAYSALDHSVTDGTTVQVPRFEFTPKGGGGGGHNFRKNTGGSGGGKGGGCFVAGTLISLQNQFKNIEDIQIGDIVLSYNEEIHQNEYSIVLQTMIHDVTEEIYDLYIEDEILTVTGIHRFYIRRKHNIEWIPASDLHIGDYVLFADGNWHPIFKIKIRIRSLLVYNFEVSHNHNYYVGRNQILAHNKGGKGGGGGSAKTIEKKEKKKHEKDYYEEVDSQLNKIQEELAGIEKQEDRLIGSKARANQQKQIALLNKEIILQERKLDILQKQEIPETKTKLDESIAELGDILSKYGLNLNMPKLEYDEDGIISNFEDISQLITDKYNELVSKQGAIADSADEEANKQIEKAMSNFEKAGDETKKLIQTLNDLQKTQVEWTNAIQESKDAVEDLNIELYKTSLEAIENLKDLNKVHAEFAGFLSGFKSDSPLRALIEDLDELSNSYAVSADRVQDFYNTLIAEKEKAKESADDDEKAVIDKEIEYFQKKINEAAAGTETELWANGEVGYYLEALRELRKWMNGEEDEDSPNIFGNNTKALYETYLDIYKKTAKSALDYEGMVEDTVKDIIDIYDEVADKQEEFLEKYEHLAKQIERYADLYALAYGEDSYDILSQIGQQQANVLKSQLNQQWEMLRWWDAQIQQAEQEGNQDLLNSLQEQRQKVIDSIGDLAQDSAKAFVDAFEKAVDASTQNILEATFKDKNFDRLDRNWEWDSEYAKKYKDEIEKAYELDSLRNNYMELLNDAQGASLNTQNKIRKQMQEQLELLKNQKTVSQYDVDLANAKLLVLQKQIALEDAQRNKNQMQLRRDSQGNYRYVYRANQDDIAKARKELLDAEYEAYELTKNHAYQTFDDIKNAYDKYLNQRADLLKNFKGTEEELAQQIKEITDAFLRSITGSAEDANDMMAGAVDVLKWMVDNTSEETATVAQNMLDSILNEAGEIKDKTGVIWLDIFGFIKGALGEDAVKVIEQANDDSIESWKGLRSELIGEDGILTAINKEITDNGGYTSAIDAAKTAIENLNIQTQSLLTDGLKPYNDAIDTNIGKINDWESALADARTTLEELEEDYKRISQIMGEDAAAKNTINIPETPPSTTTPSNNTATTTTAATKPATNTNNNKVSEAKAVAAYNWINGGRQGSNSFTNKELAAGQDLINLVYPTSLGGAGWSWDRALQYVLAKSYDTGGYTGEWGKDGKIAILHQKELVLNAEDTRNILSAVDIVRQMTSTLGNALTNYSVGGAKSGLMNSAFGAVDQRVEIKAEFPNVRDAFEIETALTNLADTAYQYAHRKI